MRHAAFLVLMLLAGRGLAAETVDMVLGRIVLPRHAAALGIQTVPSGNARPTHSLPSHASHATSAMAAGRCSSVTCSPIDACHEGA